MPSLAFSAESDETLKQLLTTAPKAPSDSKAKSVENYSPVVDLRNSKTTQQYDEVYEQGFSDTGYYFNSDTDILVNDITGRNGAIRNLSFNSSNNALITMNFYIDKCANKAIFTACGGFAGNWGNIAFNGNGTFIINADMNANQNYDETSGFFDMAPSKFAGQNFNIDITSRMIFKATGNVGAFIRTTSTENNGFLQLNSPYLEIDMDNNGANKNNRKYFIYTQRYYGAIPTFYINANESNPSQANDPSSILKITGSIMSAMTSNIYAHFSNASSF
ncbi:hypothetical protein, partial [uncultured Helicobacter sp.]|uniref:hypothetical protein n=1 Tax=uncultured Helicobacter sp. TaxID=175537 RepID=UPI00260B04BB